MKHRRRRTAGNPRKLLLALVALFLVSALSASASDVPPPATEAGAEEFAFQTEVSRVMNIIINSLYKTKEIFLRELISNASDAVDKVRFLGITDKAVLQDNAYLNITIEADPASRWLTIQDSGIGMTKAELKKNLGTIAKSGTADFISAVEKNKDELGLIGQFGVGFYSAFLVADRVQVISKHPSDPVQHVWESTDASKFTLAEDPSGNTLGRGTRIRLHLKDDATEFLDQTKLRELVKKYSEFVQFPIYLRTTKTVEVEAEEPETPAADAADAAEKKDEEAKEDKPVDDEMVVEDAPDAAKADAAGDKKAKTVSEEVVDWEQVNVNKPIWLRSAADVPTEDYNAFFKAYFNDADDPAAHIHFKGEGGSDFKSLLFIPRRPPNNMFQADPQSFIRNIKLFVRRVFITDELIDFLPRYLSFIKGVIDSDDFPLNVSRETVQQTRLLKVIKNKVVSKTLQMFKTLARNATSYEPLYKAYASNLKAGILEDTRNAKKLTQLLRFHSTGAPVADDGRTYMTSLDDYVERMRKGQQGIYFLTGNDLDQMRKSPYLEALTTRGYEVLLMDESLDEYVTQSVTEFDGVKLINVGKGKLTFGDEDDAAKSAEKELADEFQPLTTWLTEQFKDTVDKTLVSNRLTTTPCALIAAEGGWTGRMQEIMEAQKAALANSPGAFMYEHFARQKKTLEINPNHPVMRALLERVEDDAADNDDTRDLARSLLAWIKGGYPIKDLDGIARRIETAVRLGLKVDLDAKAKVDVKEAPVVEAPAKKKAEAKADDEDEEAAHDEL
uniref:Hsp90B n=1 Tax=Blastocladiella emersonii TaxID=4808 RepID=B1NK18_BLAEM|nr:Hsp90B [Blastocladiella emersonii]